MTRRSLALQFAYYLIFPVLLYGCLRCSSFALGPVDNLGTVIAVTYLILYFALPIATAFFLRLSLLKWYVDPFAAAEPPLLLYLATVLDEARDTGSLAIGFARINSILLADHAEGLLFFIGLFVFGLAASFSVSRKNGDNLPYRLLKKLGILPR